MTLQVVLEILVHSLSQTHRSLLVLVCVASQACHYLAASPRAPRTRCSSTIPDKVPSAAIGGKASSGACNPVSASFYPAVNPIANRSTLKKFLESTIPGDGRWCPFLSREVLVAVHVVVVMIPTHLYPHDPRLDVAGELTIVRDPK